LKKLERSIFLSKKAWNVSWKKQDLIVFEGSRLSVILPRDIFLSQKRRKKMGKPKSFEERYYTEYKLRKRVRLSLILSMIFYPSFALLDVIYTPECFVSFLIIRLIVVLLNAVMLSSVNIVKSTRGLLNLAMAFLIIDALGIALMTQIMGGFMSSYYQGLTLVVMCTLVLMPFVFRESVIVLSAVWASYLIPSLVNIQKENLDWRIAVNNLFFLTSIVVIGVFASYVMASIRIRALKSRIRLEVMTKKLRESNVKLKSLDELKTQFFANVNHELRTPLTLMLAPLGPIEDGQMGRVTAKQKDAIQTIRRNGFRLLKLINNLLDLTKLEEGQMRLKVQTIDFIDYINSLLASVKPLADQKEIQLYFQHPPHTMDVAIDPDQFEKVVLNLLSNAIKFTPENGRVTVYVEERKKSLTLVVEDSGAGIPENMLCTIFDRFSQVDGSLSRSHEGTGIGLSLVKEITNLHSGTVRAESKVGKGSRFIVELRKGDKHFTEDVLDRRVKDVPVKLKKRSTDVEHPKIQDIVSNFRDLQLIDLDRRDEPSTIACETKGRDHHLLVIDDNPEVLRLMKMLLGEDYDIESTTSAEDGLEIMMNRIPDLVLCDVMMPGMDGYTFCKRVKDEPLMKHTPVILVTARSGADMLREGIEAGADDYISKPFDSTELKARIRSLLRMRKIEADLAHANRNLKMRAGDLVERQQSLFIAMIKSLVSAIDAKDKYTQRHSLRVTELSLKIARKMGFSERELRDLELAALLHDIGKIGVPEAILNKEGKLTDEEYSLIKEHPERGERILEPIIELKQISQGVRAHHERYDGRGYPDGLKGQEIPLAARIMAVCDTYDAITSDRPYRKTSSHNYAVKEIIRCSGEQFDPEVVEIFVEVASEIHEEKEIGSYEATLGSS
jgi:putative nucleotidyltransferase with HDIG domain